MRAAAAVIGCLLLLPAWASDDDISEFIFSSVLPLGSDAVLLQPGDRTVYLLVSAHAESLEGMRRIGRGRDGVLLNADGAAVSHYPQWLHFRISVTLRRDGVTRVEPLPAAGGDDVNAFLLGLRFRLRAIAGLEALVLQPAQVRHLGVPAEVPFDERIYQVSFRLDDLPLDRRLVLDVLSPTGERIGKFNFELL